MLRWYAHATVVCTCYGGTVNATVALRMDTGHHWGQVKKSGVATPPRPEFSQRYCIFIYRYMQVHFRTFFLKSDLSIVQEHPYDTTLDDVDCRRPANSALRLGMLTLAIQKFHRILWRHILPPLT